LKALAGAPLSAESRARFLSERQILANLHHPNIAQLLDGGLSDEGTPYFVMELVEGSSIDEFSDSNGLSVPERLELFLQVCAGVSHAHQNLVVHRDLKPSNILVTEDGTVKLLDFGIARMLQPEDGLYLTATQAPHPMTVAYASPEQIRGEPPNTSCDVYGLGVLLYRLLTGRHPYDFPEGSGYVELSRVICETIPTAPSERLGSTGNGVRRRRDPGSGSNPDSTADPERNRELIRSLKGDLDWIVLKALEKEPDRRYGSVAEFADDVRRYLSGWPVTARPVTLSYRARRFVGRHRGPVATAALVAVLVMALGVLGVRYVVDTRAQSRALAEETQATQAVSDFLVGLFTLTDPSAGGGDTLTARGRARTGQELGDVPIVHARVLGTLARVYRGLGFAWEADSLALAAVELNRDHLGPTHPETLNGALYLGQLGWESYNDVGMGRAEVMYREILDLIRDSTHLAEFAARAEVGLGQTLIRMGRAEEALPHVQRGLALASETFASDDPDFLVMQNARAALYRQLEMPDSAELVYRELLAAHEARGPEGRSLIGVVLNNLGYLMRVRGRLEEAEAFYLRSLREFEEGRAPAETVILYNNLTGVLEMRGKADEMEAILQESLEFSEANWPPGHWRIGAAESGFGQRLVAVGRPEEGEPHLRRGLEIYEAALGPEHSWTARTRGNLGIALARLDRHEEARSQLEKGYWDLFESGSMRQSIERFAEELTTLYREMGRPDLAEALAQQEG
jgi:tetratricopeptide (TPR) repeat protein